MGSSFPISVQKTYPITPPPLQLHILPQPQLQQQPLPQQQHIPQQHTQQQQRTPPQHTPPPPQQRRQQHGTSLVATTDPNRTRTLIPTRCPRVCPPTTSIWLRNRSPRPRTCTSPTRRQPMLPRHSWKVCQSTRVGSTTRNTTLPFRTGSQRILTRSRTSPTSTPSPSTPSTTRSTPQSTPSTTSPSTVLQQPNIVLQLQSTVLQRRSTAHLRRRSTMDTGEDDDLGHLRAGGCPGACHSG